MANMIDQYELDGLREDFLNLLGLFDEGDAEYSIEQAKTLVNINRVISRGTINPTTKLYENPITESIYAGPSHVSPVTYRRDRQELGGVESVRIRQYRAIVPWDAGDIHLDDTFTINFSTDPNMVGRTFDVTDVLYESHLAVRRISLVDTTKDANGFDC